MALCSSFMARLECRCRAMHAYFSCAWDWLDASHVHPASQKATRQPRPCSRLTGDLAATAVPEPAPSIQPASLALAAAARGSSTPTKC